MAKDADNLDLTDWQKTRLLDVALRPAAPVDPLNEHEEREDLLYNILRCFLPLRTGRREGLRAAATASCQDICSVAGPPIGELLQDPKTSVAVLKKVKQYAKAKGADATSQQEKDVFLALYFGAIAAALAYHDEVITGHSYQNLEGFFDSFAESAWVPGELVSLLKRAGEICRERGDDQKGPD